MIEYAINTTGLSEAEIQRIREAPFVTCDCMERPGVIYKPSGRAVCGGCGGLIVEPPPPPKDRP